MGAPAAAAAGPGFGGPPVLALDTCLLISGRVAGNRLAADLTVALTVLAVTLAFGAETDLARLDFGLVSCRVAEAAPPAPGLPLPDGGLASEAPVAALEYDPFDLEFLLEERNLYSHNKKVSLCCLSN